MFSHSSHDRRLEFLDSNAILARGYFSYSYSALPYFHFDRLPSNIYGAWMGFCHWCNYSKRTGAQRLQVLPVYGELYDRNIFHIRHSNELRAINFLDKSMKNIFLCQDKIFLIKLGKEAQLGTHIHVTQMFLFLLQQSNNEAFINDCGLSWTSPETLIVLDQYINMRLVENRVTEVGAILHPTALLY